MHSVAQQNEKKTAHHVQSTRNREVEAIIRRFVLDYSVVSFDCIRRKVDSICRSGQQVQVLSYHRLPRHLKHSS